MSFFYAYYHGYDKIIKALKKEGKKMKIRNVAIIAHVDHGKTTLVDQIIRQSKIKDNVKISSMDSNEIEQERGITILAKATSVTYGDYRINILDTPGHADFGGEVERIMRLVDGVILLVDAKDGVMPQTKFVLRKALEADLKPIVVINKMDRPFADPRRVVNQVFDLFIDLGASEEQLEFPIIYASGLSGLASLTEDISEVSDMKALLDTIVNYIPGPKIEDGILLFQPSLIDYNDFVGRMGIGKVFRGTIHVNDMAKVIRSDGSTENFRIQKLYRYNGFSKEEISEAHSGDIVALAGLSDIHVGDTITEINSTETLPLIHVDEPTVQMMFLTNNSPFAGKEGKFVTPTKLEERLMKETLKDVSLKVVRKQGEEAWLVSGRGELHLSILIETMRREGFEFLVSRPKVILKENDGVLSEPYEEVTADVPNEHVGSAMELLGSKKGRLIKIENGMNETRLVYHMPSRGLIGFMTDFLTVTKGFGVLSHIFLGYEPYIQDLSLSRKRGAMISMSEGYTTAYALFHLEDRGDFFVEPREHVYEGMIVGINNKETDMVVNVVQEKKLTNMRSATKDQTVVLKRPIEMSLEACLDFIDDDEYVEVTPKSIRLRKIYLKAIDRKRQNKIDSMAE